MKFQEWKNFYLRCTKHKNGDEYIGAYLLSDLHIPPPQLDLGSMTFMSARFKVNECPQMWFKIYNVLEWQAKSQRVKHQQM